MKRLIILIFAFSALNVSAQQTPKVDTSLKFNQRFTRCEKKWVVLSKHDTASNYTFGYIYIDEQAGFTFDLKGSFKVGPDGKYIGDSTASKNTSIKYRIAPNWMPVALLPPQHFDELNIKPEPWWVSNYYGNKDSLQHNFRLGFTYNALDECQIALSFLDRVYKVNPEYPGLIFEMAFAYNALERFDDAIKLIEPALQNSPTNIYFYKELAYAYNHKSLFEKAIAIYKSGLVQIKEGRSETRGELASNMAVAYKNLGNIDEYKNWMRKAKEYTPVTSPFYKRFAELGF